MTSGDPVGIGANIHKTGSTQRTALLWEEDRATATGNT